MNKSNNIIIKMQTIWRNKVQKTNMNKLLDDKYVFICTL